MLILFAPMIHKRAKIFATADIGSAALKRLIDCGYDLEVYSRSDAPPRSVLIEKVRMGVNALITTLRDSIDAELLAAGKDTLRIIAQDAVGIDNIDRQAANRYRIPFANTAGVLTESTAEFALFILGAVSRKLYPSEKLVEANEWTTWHPYEPFLGNQVTGKTVGVIGAGRIGKAFARKCVGLDVDLLLCSKNRADADFEFHLNAEMKLRHDAGFCPTPHTASYVDIDSVLARSDYVSVHVPLILAGPGKPTTRHLINPEFLAKMKPTAYLINTSRGPVVDEQALYDALIGDRIAGAALDVFEREPLPPESPLRDPSLKNRLRLFHHFASGTAEARLSPDPNVGMAGRTVQAVIDVLEARYGGNPADMPYIVNKEAFR